MITLINPPAPFASDPAMNPQLGLCYVSAALKSGGYDVEGIDFCVENYERYNSVIPLTSEVYGFYCMSVQYKFVKNMCKFIKANNPKALIFVGGPHATCCPEDFKGLADHIIRGNSNWSMWAINDTLRASNRNYNNDLIPDRSIFDKYQYHRTINGERAHHIVTLMGCPYSCNYCDKKSVGRQVRYRSISNVLKEIELLIEKYNTRSFVIYDDIFTLSEHRLKEFCIEFSRRNLQWRCWSRTDLVNKKNLKMMKDSGLTSITFGVESGDATVLKRINKKTKVDDNYGALLLCQNLGIPVRCSLMFGNPGESKESLLNTIDMIRFCTPDEWNLAVLKPMPGSAFWDYPERFGIKFDKQAIIDSDYEILNRFEDNGVGNIICSIDSCSDDELKELLPWFINELERVCPRKKIQDTIQDIKIIKKNKEYPNIIYDSLGYSHEPGCPAIADDESDYKYLFDAGECTCKYRRSK